MINERAIESLKTLDDIFSEFESLVDQIEQEDDVVNATERIDKWCIEKLRSVIAIHYADRAFNALKSMITIPTNCQECEVKEKCGYKPSKHNRTPRCKECILNMIISKG